MASISRLAQRLLKRPPSPLHQILTTGFHVLEKGQLIEEERLPHYSPTQFFPVNIGDGLNARYQVVGKLGHGGNSTAWLSRDLNEHKYVTVKVCRRESEQVTREINAYRHLNTLTTSHVGALLIREMTDSFDISNAHGRYPFDGDRTIYKSRSLVITKNPGRPVITDFGEARIGQQTYDDDIQPFQYRAPEVIMGMPWSYEVDIWNVGVMIWDLFYDKNMFHTRGPDGIPDSLYHMAHITALLGPAPLDFLERSHSKRRLEYYDQNGKWKGLAEIPQTSLEESEENLDGEDKGQFLEFIRKMLKWRPEERSSAEELLEDTWLRSETT
ncbi:hypothetical protein VF21_08971 [Pseudogymnoascus sp. 05NY08]|nr:hypothetical protein VF21_08971 [Pseudogymnoascus sp. 05NY08]